VGALNTYQDIQYSTVAKQFEDYVKGIALKKRKKITIRK
jgi:hypothetical protein